MADIGTEKMIHGEKIAQCVPKTTGSAQEKLAGNQKLRHIFAHAEFAGSTLPVGFHDLGRDCGWLLGLRLAATRILAPRRRSVDDAGVFFYSQRVADVADLHRGDVRGLLAGETGILKFNWESRRHGDPNQN
jgi:hypothetical protein